MTGPSNAERFLEATQRHRLLMSRKVALHREMPSFPPGGPQAQRAQRDIEACAAEIDRVNFQIRGLEAALRREGGQALVDQLRRGIRRP